MSDVKPVACGKDFFARLNEKLKHIRNQAVRLPRSADGTIGSTMQFVRKEHAALQAEIEALRQKVGTGRAIIVDLLDQIDSLQSYELTRDLEGYKAQAIWDSAIENAKRYAAIAKEKP